jgi:hypothetical protein
MRRMDLIPSERAVLGQIRDLFLESSLRTYRLALLTGRWPVIHYDAFNGGYEGLARKGLIAKAQDGQAFSITNAGMKAMVARAA